MNKNYFAKTPPMGWNSYDYYDTTVTEADIKANADYMAENLKKYGYEYVVVDIVTRHRSIRHTSWQRR